MVEPDERCKLQTDMLELPGPASLLALHELEKSLADYWQRTKADLQDEAKEKNIIDFSPQLLFILSFFLSLYLFLRLLGSCLGIFLG